MTTRTESARFALAMIAALAIGFLAQAAVYAIVSALTYPNALRFFGVGAILIYYTPTLLVMLAVGAPLVCMRPIRVRLQWSGGAIVAALLGALGASVPEIYTCINPHIRCFLTTYRDLAAGLGLIFSGAACGAAIYFVYERMAPTEKTHAIDPETI